MTLCMHVVLHPGPGVNAGLTKPPLKWGMDESLHPRIFCGWDYLSVS